jgi:Na+/H+ antiporter NhaD/arsenite permease-like protein
MDTSLFIALVTFLMVYAILATEKINRVIIVFVGSIILLITGVLTLNEAINYVNWETIGLLFGMFIIVVVLSDAGLFSYLAFVLAKKLKYKPRTIFIVFPFLAGVLAFFINSITVMLFLATLTIGISRLLKIDPVPIIVAEVILANTGGASSLIGNPPNVILGTQLGFGFNQFVANNGPIALVASLSSIGLLYALNKKSLPARAPVELETIAKISQEDAITNGRMLKLGLGALFFAVLLLVTQEHLENVYHIPLTVALAALIPAFALLLVGGADSADIIKRVDYDVLLFFIGLFILVGGLVKTGVVIIFANGLVHLAAGNAVVLLSLVLYGSGAVSAVVDNVPFALTMSYVIKALSLIPLSLETSLLVWTVSLGTNIGGNVTPIGASSNVLAYSSLEKHGVRVGWRRWMKIAIPPTALALVLCNVMLYIKYLIGFY